MENWKTIENVTNYEVSDLGQIRNTKTNYILKGRLSKSGYLQVSLTDKETKKQKNYYIHRLVAIYFLENLDNKREVNHKDGNKLNNNIINLEWATHSENTIHAINMGLKKVFNNEVSVILSDDEVASIIYMYETLNMTAHEICNKLNKEGLSYVLVENICVGACRKSYRNNLYNHY